MKIGDFTKKDDKSFIGTIQTLTLQLDVTMEPVTEKMGEKGPDYRVLTGYRELGAAWRETSNAGKAYLSVRIDDPALPQPLNCALVKTGAEVGYSLVWERQRKRKSSEPAGEF